MERRKNMGYTDNDLKNVVTNLKSIFDSKLNGKSGTYTRQAKQEYDRPDNIPQPILQNDYLNFLRIISEFDENFRKFSNTNSIDDKVESCKNMNKMLVKLMDKRSNLEKTAEYCAQVCRLTALVKGILKNNKVMTK